MPAGRRGGVILVNPGISGVFLKTGPGTPLGVASLNLNLSKIICKPCQKFLSLEEQRPEQFRTQIH